MPKTRKGGRKERKGGGGYRKAKDEEGRNVCRKEERKEGRKEGRNVKN
jgi:hypothetical protein